TRRDLDAGRVLALGIRRARRPDDPLTPGPTALRARLGRLCPEPRRDRLRQYPGGDRAVAGAPRGLAPRSGPLLRWRQRHDIDLSATVVGRCDDERGESREGVQSPAIAVSARRGPGRQSDRGFGLVSVCPGSPEAVRPGRRRPEREDRTEAGRPDRL